MKSFSQLRLFLDETQHKVGQAEEEHREENELEYRTTASQSSSLAQQACPAL